MAPAPRKTAGKAKPAVDSSALLVAEPPVESSVLVAEPTVAAFQEEVEAPVVQVPVQVSVQEPVEEPVKETVPESFKEPLHEPVAAPTPAPVAQHAPVAEATAPAVAEAGALEGSFGLASKSLQAFSAKALEAYQTNAAASVQYVQALSNVRSVSDAIALQSEHMRKQYESLSTQAKELTILAQQVAAEAAGPLKDQFGKAFKSH
jgi:hypothetical protein